MKNIVYIAIRKDNRGCCAGYFLSKVEGLLPPGFKLAARPELDITDIMTANRCTVLEALKLMNRHWEG